MEIRERALDRNARQILRILLRVNRDAGKPRLEHYSLDTLEELTQLSRGTVHSALQLLKPILSERSVRASELQGRPGGKPKSYYGVKPTEALALALELDHDRGRVVVSDAAGHWLYPPRETEVMVVDDEPEAALTAAADLLRTLLRQPPRSRILSRYVKGYERGDIDLSNAAEPPIERWRERVVGVGVAMPSPVDTTGGKAIGGVLPAWEGLNPARELVAGLRLPSDSAIVVGNDGDLGALAEHRYGAGNVARKARMDRNGGEPVSTLMFVKTSPGSEGIGGGAIINGEPFRGRGMAMELGHVVIDVSGPLPRAECPHCGQRKCLQARTTVAALIDGSPGLTWEQVIEATNRRLQDALVKASASAVAHHKDEARARDRARREFAKTDEHAAAILKAGHYVGIALAHVVTLLAPEVIVLGGPLADAWSALTPGGRASIQPGGSHPVRAVLEDRGFRGALEGTRLMNGVVPQRNAGAAGAIALVLEQSLEDFLMRRALATAA